jgi:hypothetical protein
MFLMFLKFEMLLKYQPLLKLLTYHLYLKYR